MIGTAYSAREVDVSARRSYVADAMNLLLLLSALLSALAGVGGSVRAPSPAQAVTSAAAAQVAPAPPARASARPVSVPPALAGVAAMRMTIAALPLAIPLWASRRRE
jgi:hypothetical protein